MYGYSVIRHMLYIFWMPKSSGVGSDLCYAVVRLELHHQSPMEPFEKPSLIHMRSVSGSNTAVHLLVSDMLSPLA